MRLLFLGFLSVFFLVWPGSGNGQTSTNTDQATRFLKTEQQSFIHFVVNSAGADADIVQRLSRFVSAEVDSFRLSIMKDPAIINENKVRGIQSIAFFMEGLRDHLSSNKTDLYSIPASVETYKAMLHALLYNKPWRPIIEPLNARRSHLMASTFRLFKESNQLTDIATYKRMITSPEYILQYLERNPSFRYADSLLLYVAANDPMRMANYLRRSTNTLQSSIRNSDNIYIKQIVELSKHRNASELMPFIAPIAENRLTVEEVLKKRLDVTQYYQLMVNTLISCLYEPEGPATCFQQALRNGIKEKSRIFYINRINELHNSPSNIRFAAIKGLRPIDLYYIITSSGDELYTSSYLGIYRKLMEYCKKQTTDSLFNSVKYDGFREFMRMAANYNTLSDFFNCLPKETGMELLHRYVSHIETDTDKGLEKAMDVADAFTGVANDPELGVMMRNELQLNYGRCEADGLYFGSRLYEILLQVYDLVKQKDASNKLLAFLGDYERLDMKSLLNKKGEIVELVLFYGDEDGVASFNSFRAHYKDSSVWETTVTDKWIRIASRGENPVVIYANRPLDHEEEQDLHAQEALSQYLWQNKIEPVILIHRGHSYHLKHTMLRMQPSVKLAVLGSCGGYNNIISVANISPNAQIIASKKIGSKLINDPMLDLINDSLNQGEDLVWSKVWEKLEDRFKKDAFTLALFSEYIPPTKNISLFVLKLFNYSQHDRVAVSR